MIELRIPLAASLMTELLDIRKAEKDTARFLSTMGNLIEAYRILNNNDKVNSLLSEIITLPVDSQRFAKPLKRIHNLAYFQYYKEEKYADALLQLKGLERCNSISYTERAEGELRLGLGRIYNRKKDFKRAHKDLKKATKHFTSLNYNGGLNAAYFELAELAMEEKRPEEALEFYQRANNSAVAPGAKMTALRGLLNVYRRQGKFEKALNTFSKVHTIKDSLQGAEMQRAVLEIESNGKGYKKEETKERAGKKSRALRLIEQRLKLLDEADGKNYRFEINKLSNQADKQGTLVQLYLPYSAS